MKRLCVYRTPRHIYAQIISELGDQVIASASTLEKETRKDKTGNTEAAVIVGKLISERAKKAGVQDVYFDRGGFLFHGKVKALAEAAREGGLKF